MSFDHGGDWAGYYEKHGTLPLDFSASISPLGLPAGVREAVVRALDHADRYPDPLCRELRTALGERYGVPDEWILCGTGEEKDLAVIRRFHARSEHKRKPISTYKE